jgi:hypothetical protein
MSIGYGVGDFITILQQANKIRERFVDAPGQFKAISDEWATPSGHILDAYWLISRVRSLSIILEDVKVVLSKRDLTSEQRKDLVDIFVGCCDVLNTLDKLLDKYQELGSDPKVCDPHNLSFKVRRGWKRLKWEPEDVKELRSRITSNISLLNVFNGQLHKYLPTPLLMDERN